MDNNETKRIISEFKDSINLVFNELKTKGLSDSVQDKGFKSSLRKQLLGEYTTPTGKIKTAKPEGGYNYINKLVSSLNNLVKSLDNDDATPEKINELISLADNIFTRLDKVLDVNSGYLKNNSELLNNNSTIKELHQMFSDFEKSFYENEKIDNKLYLGVRKMLSTPEKINEKQKTKTKVNTENPINNLEENNAISNLNNVKVNIKPSQKKSQVLLENSLIKILSGLNSLTDTEKELNLLIEKQVQTDINLNDGFANTFVKGFNDTLKKYYDKRKEYNTSKENKTNVLTTISELESIKMILKTEKTVDKRKGNPLISKIDKMINVLEETQKTSLLQKGKNIVRDKVLTGGSLEKIGSMAQIPIIEMIGKKISERQEKNKEEENKKNEIQKNTIQEILDKLQGKENQTKKEKVKSEPKEIKKEKENFNDVFDAEETQEKYQNENTKKLTEIHDVLYDDILSELKRKNSISSEISKDETIKDEIIGEIIGNGLATIIPKLLTGGLIGLIVAGIAADAFLLHKLWGLVKESKQTREDVATAVAPTISNGDKKRIETAKNLINDNPNLNLNLNDYEKNQQELLKKELSLTGAANIPEAKPIYTSLKNIGYTHKDIADYAFNNLSNESGSGTQKNFGGKAVKAVVQNKFFENTEKSGQSINKRISPGYKLSGNATFNNMQPDVLQNFKNMAAEYYQRTGKNIQVNSGYRSFTQQTALYHALGPGKAAAPGNSQHELGKAIDINSADAAELASSGLLAKHGFERKIAGESWHLTPIGTGVPIIEDGSEKNYAPTQTSEEIQIPTSNIESPSYIPTISPQLDNVISQNNSSSDTIMNKAVGETINNRESTKIENNNTTTPVIINNSNTSNNSMSSNNNINDNILTEDHLTLKLLEMGIL